MQTIVVKQNGKLIGVTDQDHDAFCRFKRKIECMEDGEYLRVSFATPRNPKHHRKFFALLKLITENSETYNTVEKALVAVKLVVAHCEPIIDPTSGEIVSVPKSIAFDAMSQEQFESFYERAIDGVLEHVVPQLDEPTANKLIDMIVNEWGR